VTGRHAEGVLRHDDPLPSHLAKPAVSGRWLPLLGSNQAARVQSPVPYQLGEGALVPRAGLEPASSDLKDRCPRPLDERGNDGAGSENRTRVICLEGSSSATELCPHRAQGWRGGCAQRKMADGAGIEPARPMRSRRISIALPYRSANHPDLQPSG
jgi:hypothetical protein